MRGEFVDVAGVRLYCYAFGERGAGVPIVLVHGAFLSSHLWQDVLPRLPKGHRVLVLDLLGHGRSDPAGALPMTVAAHAARLITLLDVLGVHRAALIGHGMGAAIAAVVAATHPTRVTQLMLVNPIILARGPAATTPHRRVARLAALLPLWRRLPPAWLASALHTALLPGYAQRDLGARALDVYLKHVQTRDGRASAAAQLRALAASNGDTAPALATAVLRCPVMLATSPADPFVPTAHAARLADQLRAATTADVVVRELAGTAHVAPEEVPDRLGALVTEFLTA